MSIYLPDLASQVELDHERLHTLKSSLSELMAENVGRQDFLQWKVETLFRLRDFHSQLAKHFDLEEIGGFFTDLLRLSPESAHRVQRLKRDHAEILFGLGRLVAELRMSSPADRDGLRRQLDVVLQRLKSHEAMESELLYTAHHQVYGAGD